MGESKVVRLLALLVGLMLAAAACAGDGEPGTAESAETDEQETAVPDQKLAVEQTPAPDEAGSTPGTLIWTHEQEPPDLHLDDPNNFLTITSWIREAMLDSLFGVDSTTTYYPELLAGEPSVTIGDDGAVLIEYTLRDGLMWSDGTPLTSSDVEYTHKIIVEGCAIEADGSIVDATSDGCVYLKGDRSTEPYDLVTSFDVIDDTHFNVKLASFSAGWRALYSQVYAAHAFGVDAAAVNENLKEFTGLPASGPMVFDSWERGVSLKLVRNDNYHGSVSPDARNKGVAFVERVQIDFAADTDSQIDSLLAGEAQIIMTQPQLSFERLVNSDDFTAASSAGPVFEHWGLNLLNPHLAKPEVREALAYALDKNQIVTGLYTPLFGSVLPSGGLGNTYWMTNQPAYEDHQTKYAGNNIDGAKAALESAGYALGDDNVYVHPTDGRLSLRVGTTGGIALRELQEELIQQQMAGAGIEIIIDNVAGGAYFGERPFAKAALAAAASGGAQGDPTIWDITQFAWVGGPWPGGQSGSYRSGLRNNPYGFANAEFDVKASECDATVDDAERAGCYNDLDKYVTTLEKGDDGLFMIPLTQKPSFFGYLSSQLQEAAISPDANLGGPLSNVVDYQLR